MEISVFASENQPTEPENGEFKQPPQTEPLSRKQRRLCLKRDRRKRKRQALAKLRECDINLAVDQYENEDHDDGDDKTEEEQRERLHQEWLQKERIAQEEFRLKKEKEAAAQRIKEEEEKRIKDEWEEQQRREREEREQKQQEKRNREEAVQKMLDQAQSQLENGGSWKNPDAPADYGTEKDKANCPFFLKTGACRFGDRCSRKHDHPVSSSTLMVRGMFVTFGMEQSRRDDYDTDASLEYSEEELHQQFLDFYEDVLPEFRNAGKVIQFKVSCNFEPHLRGNVYVQYENEDQCKEAFMVFNGRWYAGRQLQCEFSPVTRWKTAICGLFDRQKCPKGKHCNFLHVFRNPGNEFWEADRDLHLSPDRGGGFTSWHSERRDRILPQRNRSPEPSRYRRDDGRSRSGERHSHKRRRSNSRERRSHSRQRRSHSRSRERRRPQYSLRRGQGRANDLSRRSRSHERRRLHSRGRESDRQSRSRHSVRDSRRSSRRSESDSPKEQHKNGSVKRMNKSSDASANANTSSHHHKHSKKSKKKKSKRKQKRKMSRTRSVSSSAGSEKESEDDEDEVTLTNRDKQNTEMPAEDSRTTETITTFQQGHGETHTSKVCQHEDEKHVTLAGVADESGTAALSNEDM
ncbi:U2 small nuclear ribonucleoprotein auxiliary factor 35 kDa subunit-related protein 2 [Electrophorus electricus]|uniref:U2 small nuclear ribonucleoprotein auxiliary factor 35 kDa subunit-related protein 2 n=1 Tax=Electrophorus electricus TaxID=8005 RepID=UPI0015D04596|nr:U2 small nuclear ribonucleoprotein auxiliary factor 35 kDa subunit-related protein 2 [Electrophorus electricus]